MRLMELLPGRLYYTASEKAPSAPDMYTFNIDADFVSNLIHQSESHCVHRGLTQVYEHFFADFGPLHLGRVSYSCSFVWNSALAHVDMTIAVVSALSFQRESEWTP